MGRAPQETYSAGMQNKSGSALLLSQKTVELESAPFAVARDAALIDNRYTASARQGTRITIIGRSHGPAA